MIRRPSIPFSRLLAYSLMLVAPTVLALDALVFLRDLGVDFAIWVVAGAMVSSVVIAWLFIGDMSEMAQYVEQGTRGDPGTMPSFRSGTAKAVAVQVAQLNRKWRSRVDVFSRSINIDMQILETLHDPLVFVDPLHRVVRANAAARALFGHALGEEPIEAALRPPELLQAVIRSLETGEVVTLQIDWPGLFARYFDARVLPVGSAIDDAVAEEAGAVPPAIAAVVTLHETTELRQAAELRERFIANVSHELRTPLSSIIGFIETIQGPARDDADAQSRFLQIMHDQAMRMNRIVADLLSLARIEENEREAPRDPVNLAMLLHEVVDGLDLRAVKRGMHIELSLPGDLPLVQGDRDQLFQVFQNLLDNAIKYGAENTPIQVVARLQPGLLSVCVRDKGDGIEAEHLAHLGERFYRVDRARSRSTGGSGLGLAIVRKIVARHRGAFKVESTPGIGSTFHVELPLAER